MAALTRMWGAVAALGAALIALAVGAAATPWLAVPMLAAGLGQLAVCVAALRGTRWHAGLVAVPLALPTLLWLGALLLAPAEASSLPFAPLLAESTLALGAAALLLRRRTADDDTSPGLMIVGLLTSAAAVAAITTTALAGTHAGAFAQPHGEHGIVVDAEHGGH
ncbi:hypothetical protein [Agrococcus sp. DT81.2]|uniref:hypothetical protein n=1 Tax=Agrococcus sp. DT81.2 TaxID=3393414 RepID=UPI003CE56703